MQLAKFPDVGVPSRGAISVGVFANTKAPEPVSPVISVFNSADVVEANCARELATKASPTVHALFAERSSDVPFIVIVLFVGTDTEVMKVCNVVREIFFVVDDWQTFTKSTPVTDRTVGGKQYVDCAWATIAQSSRVKSKRSFFIHRSILVFRYR